MFFQSLISQISSLLKSQATFISSFFSKLTNVQGKPTQVVQKKLREVVTSLTRDPNKKKDYVKLLGLYVAKKVLIISIIVLAVLIFLIVKFAYPWADGRLWTANIQLNSVKFHSFSGKARVYDGKILIYQGTMDQGKITGTGKQYDKKGNLIYVGSFENAEYSGNGKVYIDGVLRYSGNFSKNLYEGQGSLYNAYGTLIYSGDFSKGEKSGKGVEYNPNTSMKEYYGDFANNLREGRGVEYSGDGVTVVYDGNFSANKYSGAGTLKENDKIKYNGEFTNGLFEGKGTLYDIQTSKIIYEGDFKGGVYEGDGTLYAGGTSRIVYKGAFVAGKRQGDGTAYDKIGSAVFTGKFKDDIIDYVSYLGKGEDDIKGVFGKETYRTEKNDRLLLSYVGLNSCVVFTVDPKDNKYVCEKVVVGMRDTFMGLTSKSTEQEVQSVLGVPFSTINYSLPGYFDTIASNLSIDLGDKTNVIGEKFIMDSYFIRFYYNSLKNDIKCVEICGIQ